MKQFPKLIKSLKAFTIIFIENAFVYEEEAEKILAKFCFLPEKNRTKILERLTEYDQQDLASKLSIFQIAFAASNRNTQLEIDLPAIEYFKHYLNEIKAVDLDEYNTPLN